MRVQNNKITTIGISMPKDARIRNLLMITIGEVLPNGKNMTFSKNYMCFLNMQDIGSTFFLLPKFLFRNLGIKLKNRITKNASHLLNSV